MTKPTQMEKLDEIVRALEKLNDGGNWFHTTDEAGGPHTAWRGHGEPDEIAWCALTLARELRESAVEGCCDADVEVDACDGVTFWEDLPGAGMQPCLLIIDRTP